jgi:hypothetical protein
MSKRTSQLIQSGQQAGANLKIETVHNDGLQEYVIINNHGTIAQPLSGWVLTSLRGQVFYSFPENLILMPGMTAAIHSGWQNNEETIAALAFRADLTWTKDQIWNNHGDIAILFDANGTEIDRYAYPHLRQMGSSDECRKMLTHSQEHYQVVDVAVNHTRKTIRYSNDIPRSKR